MKKSKYILIFVCLFCATLIIAFIVNVLFKYWKTDGIFSAEWLPGDALNYMGTMSGAVSTFILGLVAYKQNEKLQKLEDNNYIALNSCMVFVKQVKITPKANTPGEANNGQILKEAENTDKFLVGYKIEVNLKKIDTSIQATPALIYVSKCLLFVGDKKIKTLKSNIWAENERESYTRIAILESGMAFECMLLVSQAKQKKFEEDIKEENNRLTVEFEFNIITDKYVMTKCKCRAYCDYLNSSNGIIWHSDKPQAFFYGHELKNRNEIQVLGEK